MTPFAHVFSVAALWTLMLTGLRFGVDALSWLRPLFRAGWHLLRCRGPDRSLCLSRFVCEVDALHTQLQQAIRTPWSATMLFGGCALIGFGYVAGASGNIAELVSSQPERWADFDAAGDCLASIMAVTGMVMAQVATSPRRTASLMVSIGLILTGIGVGAITI